MGEYVRLIFLGVSIFIFAAFFPPVASAQTKSKGTTIVLDARNGPPTIPVTIGGEIYTFLVDPSLKSRVVLNASIAKKHKLRSNNLINIQVSFEDLYLPIKYSKVKFKLGDSSRKYSQRGVWFEQDLWPPYDGVIGGGALKADKVVFLLSDSTAEQTQYSGILKSKKYWVMERSLGEARGLDDVRIYFKPYYTQTFANLFLSKAMRVASLATLEPESPDRLVFDVDRAFSKQVKVINSQLTKPISLLKGDVDRLKLQVPESDLIPDDDEDAVIVTADTRKVDVLARSAIYLGKDYFEGCTKLEFTPKEKRVDLYCNAGGSGALP